MYEFCAISDSGCVRENNEDGFLVGKVYANSGEYRELTKKAEWLIAVADGMGGHEAGEIASKIALDSLKNCTFPVTSEEIQLINNQILAYGNNHLVHKGLGTTLTGLICIEDQLSLFHLGDSRAYRFRNGFLKQLTSDHSLVESLFQTGQITREEKNSHPEKHVLLNCLGIEPSRLKIDYENIRGTFEVGDIFLLCSDGLSDKVSVEQIEGILQETSSLQEKIQALVSKAKLLGGEDNITIVLVKKY